MNPRHAYLFRKEGLFLAFVFDLNLWSTAIIDYLKVKVKTITIELLPGEAKETPNLHFTNSGVAYTEIILLTAKGQCFWSDLTDSSSYFRPIRRFASARTEMIS